MKTSLVGRIALLILLVAGCDRAHRVATRPTVYGDPSAIVTTLTASASELTPGGSCTVHVHSVNPTRLPIRVSFTSSCYQTFLVFQGQQVAGDLTRACALLAPTETLDPGEAFDWEYAWDGTLVDQGKLVVLAPGDYQLVGKLITPGAPVSAPVTIRILAP